MFSGSSLMSMTSEDEDESLAHFLESEMLSEISDVDGLEIIQELDESESGWQNGKRLHVEDGELSEDEEKEKQEAKKIRIDKGDISDEGLLNAIQSTSSSSSSSLSSVGLLPEVDEVLSPLKGNGIILCKDKNKGTLMSENGELVIRIETGIFSLIPSELVFHILKFLSSEDLVSCSLVCRFLNFAASDESLWRRLYGMRWCLLPPKKPRECAWKKLYIQRDEEDLVELVRNCSSEFKEYYIQMQVAKRSQAPTPSQVNDDRIILDKTLADQVSMWKSSRGLSDAVVVNHTCSGEICTYYQIGDVFVCEKTGNVHVCDDTCKEVIMDPANELLVCTISGRCFDRFEMETDPDQQQGVPTDEAEPFMGSGRFARAYLLGYNCDDEKELEDTLRFC